MPSAVRPVTSLNRYVVDNKSTMPPITLVNTTTVSLEELRRGPHAISLRNSVADGNQPIFCGNIG